MPARSACLVPLLILCALSQGGCPRPAPAPQVAPEATAAPPPSAAPRTKPRGAGTARKGGGPAVTREDAAVADRLARLTARATHRRGFFETYQDQDNLYLLVPRARLGEDFLLNVRVAQGVGVDRLTSGASLDGMEAAVVALERHGDRVFLVQRQTQVTAPAGSALARAAAHSYSDSVRGGAAVEAERPDGAVLINIKDWVLGDLSQVGRAVGAAVARLKRREAAHALAPTRDRSHLQSVKGFADNLSVRARLTFAIPDPPPLAFVPDDRAWSVVMAYTFARLPAPPMAPRAADDRLGYHLLTRLDLGSGAPDFYAHVIYRFRLQADGRVGGLWRPRRPIIFYIDPSVPPELRPVVQEGVEAWQRAFTAAGWHQAIRAEPLPEGADPEDLRYPTIRWDISLKARGDTGWVVDPRSGEILTSSIRLGHGMLREHRTRDALLLGGPPADGADEARLEAGQAALARAALIVAGALAPSDPTPERILLQGLKKTVMHEVGHALGLRHNFKASAATPNERLADPAWIREHGLSVSIMDYFGVNLPRGPAPAEWYYYSPTIGAGDVLSIAWGYTPDDARARALARQAAQVGPLAGTYHNQEQANELDPTEQAFDLGSDPLAWARERADLLQALWQRLPDRLLVDDASPSELSEMMTLLVESYGATARIALPYLGGQHVSRDHVGDAGGRPGFAPVPRARQREALDFLLRRFLAEGALVFPPALLARLGPAQGRGLRREAPLTEAALWGVASARQAAVLAGLLDPARLQRMRNVEVKLGPREALTLPELFEALTQGLWGEVLAAPRNVSAPRRALQAQHLERLGALLRRGDRDQEATLAADLKALARAQLVELQRRLAAKAGGAGLDAYTRAHLAAMAARAGALLDVRVAEEAAPAAH